MPTQVLGSITSKCFQWRLFEMGFGDIGHRQFNGEWIYETLISIWQMAINIFIYRLLKIDRINKFNEMVPMAKKKSRDCCSEKKKEWIKWWSFGPMHQCNVKNDNIGCTLYYLFRSLWTLNTILLASSKPMQRQSNLRKKKKKGIYRKSSILFYDSTITWIENVRHFRAKKRTKMKTKKNCFRSK